MPLTSGVVRDDMSNCQLFYKNKCTLTLFHTLFSMRILYTFNKKKHYYKRVLNMSHFITDTITKKIFIYE